MYIVKTEALKSCVVSAQLQLICAFVFAYAKSRFSHDATHMETYGNKNMGNLGLVSK